MAYTWSQLAFVEKWRLHAVRGQIVGMYRPEDRTFFDLRLRPGEGGAGQLPGPVEIRLLDAGDMMREKRVGLMDRLTVVMRVVAAPPTQAGGAPAGQGAERGRARRRLEAGSRISGRVVQAEGDTLLVDAGMPVVVQLPEGDTGDRPRPGQSVEYTVAETPRGYPVL